MKNKIVSLLLLVTVVLMSVSLCGCKKSSAEIYFLNFKPESATIYEEIAKEYEKEKGVKVKVVTAAANTYEQTLKSEIAKKNAPTIFQVNGPIGYQSWKDYCLNIESSEIYSHLSDKSLAIKGDDGKGVYAIPYVVEGYGIIYNGELTDKYFSLKDRNNDYTSMDEIDSFDKLKKIVEDMQKKKKELGIEGVFSSTSLSSGEEWRWQTHLLNVPLYYEFEANDDYEDPTIAGLNAKELDFRYEKEYKNLFDLYVENSVTEKTLLGSKSTDDSMAEFALGKSVMVQNGNWAWSQIKKVSGNNVKEDKIKFLPMYMGISGEEEQGICIGTENYFAVNKQATKEEQEASLDFLNWLFSSETGKKYVTEQLDFITPFDTFTDSELPNDPLAKEVVRYMRDDSLKTIPWIFTSFPSENYKKDVGSALLDYVQGTKTYDEVSKTVKDKWKSERS